MHHARSRETGAPRSPRSVALPPPALPRAVPLAKALRLRRTTREISDRPLPPAKLSALLWAACGVNRRRMPFGPPGRTAGSASNSQEIDVYVARADGTWRYDPYRHRLVLAAAEDLRHLAIGSGQAPAGATAPVRLVYVADVDRLVQTRGLREPGLHDPDVQRSYYFVDTGLIAANVYLFAAAAGLAAWFHGCDRAALAAHLGLTGDRRVLFGQTVGYPLEPARRSPRRRPRPP